MAHTERHHIAIVGLMGAGKTTVAEHLSRATGLPVLDSDQWIEAATGRDASSIAADEGVSSLHDLEARALEEMLSADERRIVTPAASIVDDEESRHLLGERARVVWLDAPISVLEDRMGSARHRRPLDQSELDALMRERSPLFADVADIRLDAANAPGRIVQQILEAFPFL